MNVILFESYEAKVLPLLADCGACLKSRRRAVDGASEIHVLFFPSNAAYQAYSTDPVRIAAQEMWRTCGATVTSYEVEAVPTVAK